MSFLRMIIYEYGMTCFSTANDISFVGKVQTRFGLHSDAAEELYKERFESCWGSNCSTGKPWGVFEDLLCVNRRKAWRKKPLPFVDKSWVI